MTCFLGATFRAIAIFTPLDKGGSNSGVGFFVSLETYGWMMILGFIFRVFLYGAILPFTFVMTLKRYRSVKKELQQYEGIKENLQ